MLPVWLKRHLPELKKSGILDLSTELTFSPEALSDRSFAPYRKLVKILNISGTMADDLSGICSFPNLKRVIADNSLIKSLASFSSFKGITEISMKNTPVSNSPHFYVSVSLLLSPEIKIINGRSPTTKIDKFPSVIPVLINKGWLLPSLNPTEAEIISACSKYDVYMDSDDEYDQDILSQSGTAYVQSQHISKNVTSSSLSYNDMKLASGLSNIFATYGINIDPTDTQRLYAEVQNLFVNTV